MPLFRTQSAAEKTSLAPHDSKARLLSDHDSQGFMAKPCTPHPHCAARAALQAANPQWRGQRAGPLAFSWGSKGDILSRERISPLSAAPHGVGKSRSLFGLFPPPRHARKKRGLLFREALSFSLFSAVQKQLFRFLHRLRGSDSLRLCVGGTLLVAHEVHHERAAASDVSYPLCSFLPFQTAN